MFNWIQRLLNSKIKLKPTPDDITLEKVFTNADEVRHAFENLIANKNTNFDKRLLVIYGVGAVGKSTALKMGRLHCRREGISAVLADARNIPSGDKLPELKLLETWADALDADGITLGTFRSTRKQYYRLTVTVPNQAKQDTQVSPIISEATKLIPVFGSVFSPVAGQGAEIFRGWLRDNFSKKDMELFLEPTKQLTNAFLQDLNNVTQSGRHIILMLDTYEKALTLNRWLCSLTVQLPNKVVLVIAGREIPDWERDWTGYWLGLDTQFVGMQEMKPEDMRQLIGKYALATQGKVLDPQLVEPIIDFARGLPYIAMSAVRLSVRYGVKDFQKLKPKVVSDLIDRLLEDVAEDMKKAFKASSILRYFNVDSLKALIPDGDTNKLYGELKQWPFVSSQPGMADGMAVHETMREMINEEHCNSSPDTFHQLHKAAAEYYESRLQNATPTEAERLKLERLYHNISADEKKGIKFFQEIAEELANAMLNHFLKGLLIDANSYDLTLKNSQLWKRYYEARLEEMEQHQESAKRVYEEIAKSSDAEPKLKAYALFDLGRLYASFEKLIQPDSINKATVLLEQSLKTLPEPDSRLIQAHSQLYHIDAYRCHFEQGVDRLRKQLDFYEKRNDNGGILSTLSNFKDAYSLIGDWKKVYAVARRANEIFQSLPGSPVLRNLLEYCPWIYVWSGRYAEAESVIRGAIDFCQQTNTTYPLLVFRKDLCLALGVQGKYEDALQSFSHIRKTHKELDDHYFKEIASLLGYWGFILMNQGNLEQAEKYLKQSLEMKQNPNSDDKLGIPEVCNWLGELYEAKANQLEEEAKTKALMNAESYYQQSLKLRATGRHYFECGALTGLTRINYVRGNHLAVQSCLAEAEKLAREYEYNDYSASLKLIQGHSAWFSEPNLSSSPNRNDEEQFNRALHYYQESLIYGLRYNRFLLDEILSGQSQRPTPLLQSIIPTCLRRGEEGQRMLIALDSWWRGGTNTIDTPESETVSPISEGVPLQIAELTAREREIGDGSPQKTLIEQIDAILPF